MTNILANTFPLWHVVASIRVPRNHGNFIPLVEEVRLKRPDLYGLNSHNLYGSVPFEGSRITPLATPPAERRQNTSDVNAWARASAASKSEDMLQDESSLPPALDERCESKHDEVNTASRARRQDAQYVPVVSDGHGAPRPQSTQVGESAQNEATSPHSHHTCNFSLFPGGFRRDEARKPNERFSTGDSLCFSDSRELVTQLVGLIFD